LRSYEIHLIGKLRLPGTRRIADDRGEMDDGINISDGTGASFAVADVAAEELETRIPPNLQ
jgi:hypothetical protein